MNEEEMERIAKEADRQHTVKVHAGEIECTCGNAPDHAPDCEFVLQWDVIFEGLRETREP